MTPTELPLWTESDSGQEPAATEEEEKGPFLGLPAPSEHDDPDKRAEFEYVKFKLWRQEYRWTRSTTRVALKRTIKSLLLVWKVRMALRLVSVT